MAQQKDRTAERLLRAVELLEQVNTRLAQAVENGSTSLNGATATTIATMLEAVSSQLKAANAKVGTLRERVTAK
ncbi:MAG: hypothetical protein ACYC5O_22565 [Anaerolineae bacterium]